MKLVIAIFLTLLLCACAHKPTAKKPDKKHPPTPGPVVVYDREELENTGEPQLEKALKKVSPTH
jgi:hypothetical protein